MIATDPISLVEIACKSNLGDLMKVSKLLKTALLLSVMTSSIAINANETSHLLKLNEVAQTRKSEDLKNPYFQIKSVKVQELSDEEAMEFINEPTKKDGKPNIPPVPPEYNDQDKALINRADLLSPMGFLDSAILVVDKLIAIGQKILPIIEKGRPVVNNNPMAPISVLPKIESKDPTLYDMGNWSIPVSKSYKISFTNGFNSEVVSFIYSVGFQHSGTYNGKGKYLTGVRASAKNITVSWGFDLDASSKLVQITNVGSTENTVAGATIEISYTVKNMMRTIMTSESFFVAGDGRMFKLD